MRLSLGPTPIWLCAIACFTLGAPLLALEAKPKAGMAAKGSASGIISENLDPSIRAQDDFYQYANGGWLKKFEIPKDHSSWGIAEQMTDHAQLALRELLQNAASATDGDARRAGLFYASFMDEARLEQLGLDPIQDELEQIASLKTQDELLTKIAQLGQVGVNVPISLSVDPDARHSTRYVVTLTQAGLGMPDRDYYLKPDAQFAKDRKLYQEHAARFLKSIGDPDPVASAHAVFALECALAKVQWSAVANLDPIKVYNPIEVDRLSSASAPVSWGRYLDVALDGAHVDSVIVAQPSYLAGLSHLFHSTTLKTWQSYLQLQLLAARAPYLNKELSAEAFAFDGKVVRGIPDQSARWIRAVLLVDRLMGDATGKLYVAHYFPPENKKKVEALVGNLLRAYRARIDQLTWMSESTKIEARAKLAKIRIKIGYPDHWRDYAALDIQADDLIGNVRRANRFETRRNLAKLGRPVDVTEWEMTAATVNAYYDAGRNEIVFPAAILQPPGYEVDADDAFNYGATGATIGHEISHGFDEQGDQFDSDGNLRNWWTPADHRHYAQKTHQLVTQYNAYAPLPGVHINGALTEGENIADLAGLEVAHEAYRLSLGGAPAPVVDGLSGDQRFYLGYAQSWLSKQRPEALLAQLTADPHSPEKYRVNGVVTHLPSFYEAFEVKPGDRMYLDPAHRISLW